MAHIWLPPTVMAVAPVTPATGMAALPLKAPMPNAPAMFKPQHLTVLSLVIAQLRPKPLATAVAPITSVTSTAWLLLAVALLPSWPTELKPQHCSLPPLLTAQLW